MESVTAARIFDFISASESVRRILEERSGEDLDIFELGSLRDSTRRVGAVVYEWVVTGEAKFQARTGDIFRERKNGAESAIERFSDVAGKFEVLLLVLADWHMSRSRSRRLVNFINGNEHHTCIKECQRLAVLGM